MNDSVFNCLGIADVYRLATGRSAPACDRREARVRCPSAGHEDRRPSCTLHLSKNVWKCHACGAGGGKADLIIAAGRATAQAGAAFWLEEQLGCRAPSASRCNEAPRSTPSRGTRNTWNGQSADLRQALATEAEDYCTKRGIEHELLAYEINAIRESIAKRYRIELGPIPRRLHEGGFGGRERDPAWAGVFEWGLFVASVQLLGVPVAFDERLLPPRMVLLAAEDLAATAMRSLEHEARRARVLA